VHTFANKSIDYIKKFLLIDEIIISTKLRLLNYYVYTVNKDI